MGTDEAVAVIGMACRFPGAESIDAYWAALRDGVEGIKHYTAAELTANGVTPETFRRPGYVPALGALSGKRAFDWSFFGYSRAEAATIDPQHRIFLECASEAIDDAGLDPARFPGWIGVYAGTDGVSSPGDAGLDPLVKMVGQRDDFLTARVAYKLGLRGPAITVQTACSTSLTAVHLAAQSLLVRECDVALAGGAGLVPEGEFGYTYREGGILSPDGHCRPFDAAAAGTVPGEGVGVVVLQRLADALADGNRIAAVILGTAVSNDGGEKIGFTAPSVRGQRAAIQLAQQVADVDPADIDYIEAHGTATRIGDVVELQALTDAFRASTDATGFCSIGAVKSNIGHTGAAAGVASLIKTALMLESGELVPTLHFREANPLLDIDATPFRVCAKGGPWPDRGTRLAGVSSFGMGGSNAHAIVAGPPGRPRPGHRSGPRLIALSAASPDALARARHDLGAHLDSAEPADLGEVARTLAGRRRFPVRCAVVAEGPPEAVRLLRSDQRRVTGVDRRIAFLFPGQGALRNAAGVTAYRLLSGFRRYFDEIADVIRDGHALDLSPVVRRTEHDIEWFSDTVHQQLGLLALGYALGRQLADWGVEPVAMLGNSIGEYAAATLTGLWTAADAAELVHERARAMRATRPGHMATIGASAAEVTRRIGRDGAVSIAVAGPGTVVVTGPPAALDELLAGDALAGLDVRLLDNRRAFHSAAMAPAAETLREAVAAVPNQAPAPLLVSTLTGDRVDPDILRSPDYWARQLCRPVLLGDGIGSLLGAGCDTFLELGPGTSMTGAVRRHAAWDPGHLTVPLLGRTEDDPNRSLLRALGTLWELGADIDLDEPLAGERPIRCHLPAHPLTSTDPRGSRGTATTGSDDAIPPEPAPRPDTADSARTELERLWCRALGVRSVRDEDDFFGLGGESLMAVNLVSQIRERTTAAITVADFSRRPTFGALVALVARENGRPEHGPRVDGLVALHDAPHDAPAGLPLFLVADAFGTAETYTALARHLGDRPVYGLEPAAGRRGLPSVERLAAAHVRTILRARPSGPYVICGWSFGAIVAHEMACQLSDHGARVGLLVCIDGSPANGRGLPLGLDPGFLTMCLRLRRDAVLGRGTVGARLRDAPALRRTYVSNIGSLLRYRPRPVTCPTILLPALDGGPAPARLRSRLSRLYPGGLRIAPVAGDHWSILREPGVRNLGEEIADVLGAITEEDRNSATGNGE